MGVSGLRAQMFVRHTRKLTVLRLRVSMVFRHL